VLDELLGECPHAGVDLVGGDDLVDEASCPRLLGRDEPRGEDELLQARRSEQIQEPRVGLDRQAVAERAGDGRAEPRVRGGDAQVTGGGDAEATTYRETLDLGDDRFSYGGEPRHAPVAVALVGDAVCGRREHLELTDVGAGHEGPAPGPAQHEHPHGVVRVHHVACLLEAFVHAPGERVARLRAVEGQGDNGTVAGDEDLAGIHGPWPSSRGTGRDGRIARALAQHGRSWPGAGTSAPCRGA
jgi:hypothetical protein